MAEDLIVRGAEEIVSRLVSLAFDEIGLVLCVKRDVRRLQDTLVSIHANLQDAERKQVKEEGIKDRLQKLKEVAYDAEDVFDEIAYEQLRHRNIIINNNNGCYYYISFSFIKKVILQCKTAHRIKDINLRLADIDSRKKMCNLQPTDDQNNASSSSPAPAGGGGGIDRETTSFVDDSDVVGREDDKENIVRMLINQHITSVVAIYGLGGLGKTTLAQLAYNDDAVRKHFDLRVWICVSDNFNTTNLFTQILKKISGGAILESCKEDLVNDLEKQLKEKKFLLVLDDVWIEQQEQEKWEDFAPPLKSFGATGSKIIVTCRSHNVALTVRARAEDMYQLKGLSNDECWNIIQRRAFYPGGLITCGSRLEEIGKEISKKCKGVPLVAKVLGGLLYSKKETEWSAIQRAEIWNLTFEKEENYIIEVLKLSYNSLSPTLKSCFSYCAIFPKDYWISKELLIQLWMAQGFLEAPATQGESTMEDKGNTYINYLYSKSFFQEAKMNKFEEIEHFKMHDLVQDLAQSICKSECQFVRKGTIMREDVSKCRHVSLMSPKKVEALDKAKKLRTFFYVELESLELEYLELELELELELDYYEKSDNEGALEVIEISTLFKFKFLRVLDLSGFKGCNLPSSSHCKLKHLRYLNLSYTSIESLPTWVTWLYHLQTLKLIMCRKLIELPEDLKNLKKLRHLFIDKYTKWKKMPQAIGELNQLQTLPIFVASKEDAGRGISMLEHLNNLGGTLDIHCLCHVKEGSLAKGANLSEKRNLRELRLHWNSPSSAGGGDGDDIPVLEELQPHTNLQRLSVEGFGGVKFPAWVSSGSDLPNLVRMKLSNCNHCEHIPSFEGLLRLKKLKLRSMAKLKEWLEGDGVMFPCLEELSIKDCPNLIKTPEHVFPWLKSLELENVGGMGVVSITSSLTSLTSLTITKCKDLEFLQEGLASNNNQLNAVVISDCPKLKAFEEEGSASASVADEILPNTFLRKLMIDNSYFSNAREGFFKILKCPELEPIGKGFLSSLVFLESFQVDGNGCCKLKRIELSQSFNHLRHLEINECPYFEGFDISTTTEQQLVLPCCHTLKISYCPAISSIDFQSFASLRELRVTNCRGLQALQGLPFLTALQELEIHLSYSEDDDAVEINELQHLTMLKYLEMKSFNCLTVVPEWLGNFASLEKLSFENCKNLRQLPSKEQMLRLTSLKELQIIKCPAISRIDLTSIPSLRGLTVTNCEGLQVLHDLQFLTALSKLEMGPFSEELNDFPFALESNNPLILPCLRKLWIHGWDALQSLPHHLQRFTTLKALHIRNFSKLTELPEWLGNLTSLEELSITECKNLSHLPSKEQMQRLTLLQKLAIYHCPGLKKSCSRDGEEWPKISHIPQILIDWTWQHI